MPRRIIVTASLVTGPAQQITVLIPDTFDVNTSTRAEFIGNVLSDIFITSQLTFVSYPDPTAGTVALSLQAGIAFFGNISLDFPLIAANSTAELTITVNGAQTFHAVLLTFFAAPPAGLMWTASVTAANTVTVRMANVTAAGINPPSLLVSARVFPASA